MKKLLYIFILFISFGVYSQGNLQFNKILNLEYTKEVNGISSNNSASGKNVLATLTIPENKVWKVVHATVSEADEFRSNAPYNVNAVSNNYLAIGGTFIWASMSSNEVLNDYPIWFGSGEKELILWVYSNIGASTNTKIVSVSIIEFNVVQ